MVQEMEEEMDKAELVVQELEEEQADRKVIVN
jgi:hypothetical protein